MCSANAPRHADPERCSLGSRLGLDEGGQALDTRKPRLLRTILEQGRRRTSDVQRLLWRLSPGNALESPDPDLAPFFRSNIIFHTHVEKSAGSTIAAAFKVLFGANRIHDLRGPAAKRPSDLSAAEKSRLCVLTGHFHYGRMDRYFARHPVYVACVRHPVARFFSYYKYVSKHPGHPGYSAMAGKSFDDVAVDYAKNRHHSITNPMSRMLTGRRSPSPEMVIPHVDENYLVVAPQDNVDELVTALFLAFEKDRRLPMRRRNVGDYSDEPSSKARDVILENNQSDFLLYEYACRTFAAKRAGLFRRLRAT